MARHRRTGSRNWARGLFATFWILLGGLSGAYLFTALTNPTALGGQLVALNAGGPAPASDGTTAAIGNSGSSDQELAEIKATLRELSEQMAALTAKVGPAAALPSGARPETPPATETAAAPPPPSPPAEPPAVEVKPTPAEETESAEAPKEEPKPVEQAAVEPAEEIMPAPPSEPPAVAVSPLEEDAPAEAAMPTEPVPSPPPATQETPAAEPPAPEQPAATESAALDPIALPPAANDGSTRYGIEIGAVAKQDALRPLWREFLTNHAALVAGLQPRRVLAPDKKWRLIAGPFGSADEASQACALFKKASRPCEATVYAGDAL
jgi:sporulation related protein